MPYKVRATRRPDKGYDLSYGKGKKKLTTVTKKDPSNNKWFLESFGHFKKLDDLKRAWGKWAEAQYNGESKADGETSPAGAAPPPISNFGGIPTVTNPGAEGQAAYADDPNSVLFRYSDDHHDEHKRGKLNPLGMLMEIQAWHERYAERIAEVNQRLAMKKIPGFNPFSFLRMMVDETVEREIPQEINNGDGVRAAKSTTTATETSTDQRPSIPPVPSVPPVPTSK